MSTRPYSPLPVVDTSILRTRPAAAPISNPISLVEPVLPEVPVKAKEFDEAQIPDGLEPSLQTFSASLQLAGELAIANGLAQNGVSGLYGRSSKIQQAVSAATTSYMTALGETYGRLNDAARSADLVNERFSMSDYTIDVKKFVAQVDGVVDKYEANAEAYVQAMNIIYDADVTATKLKAAGEEKAINIESDFEQEVRKNESRAFITLDRSEQTIKTREVERGAQISIAEARQLNTHGYTAYEHERNMSAKSYEMGAISKSELDVAVVLSSARIDAAKSAAKERKDGAKRVVDARNDANTLTTKERILQIQLKTPVYKETSEAENTASIKALNDKITANTDAKKNENAAELSKDAKVMSARIDDRKVEAAGSKTALLYKEAAQIAAVKASSTSRTSLNEERINSITKGYKTVNDAKKDVSDQEYEALGEAIKIAEKGMQDVVDKRMEKLDDVLEQKFKYARDSSDEMYNKEYDINEKETNARISALDITSSAEQSAARDRANAARDAMIIRHDASAKAAEDMKRASIDMTEAKIKAAEDTLKDKYKVDEESNRITFNTKLSVEGLINSARLAAAESQSAFDLNNLRALNDARLAAQELYINAELNNREKEISAQLAAQDIILDAQSYESRKRMASSAYVAGKNMKMHSIISLSQAATEAQNRVISVNATHTSSMQEAVTQYWIASGSQNSRRDYYNYEQKK